MRFTRADLPGILIAVAAGPLLMVLFLAALEAWGHRGTPLLGFMGTNLGIAVGMAAVFSRFIRKWDWPLAFLGVILIAIGSVYWAQQTGNDHTKLRDGAEVARRDRLRRPQHRHRLAAAHERRHAARRALRVPSRRRLAANRCPRPPSPTRHRPPPASTTSRSRCSRAG